jgi:protein TonB
LECLFKEKFKVPKICKKIGSESEVILDLIVRKDGSITNIKNATMVGYGFEEEAIRLMKNCEKWKPAMKNGVPVNYKGRMTIPFVLKLFRGDKD